MGHCGSSAMVAIASHSGSVPNKTWSPWKTWRDPAMPTSGSFRVSQSVVDWASTPCSVSSLTCSPDHRTCEGRPLGSVGIACIVALALPRPSPGCHFGARRDGTVGVADDFLPGWCRVQIRHGVCLATGRCDTNTGLRAEGILCTVTLDPREHQAMGITGTRPRRPASASLGVNCAVGLPTSCRF